jgi:hypothetical protein
VANYNYRTISVGPSPWIPTSNMYLVSTLECGSALSASCSSPGTADHSSTTKLKFKCIGLIPDFRFRSELAI